MDIEILRKILAKDLPTQNNEIIEEAIEGYLSISNRLDNDSQAGLDQILFILSESDD